jgi:peptidoglycan/xylan/chitin deacetylase (PgdA/CDA1 family)
MSMKNITILIVSLLASACISFLLYLDDDNMSDSAGLDWKYKGRERNSRLLAVPILLYHNINGRGPFSIRAAALREHFQLIKDRGIRVISLKELERRLGNPVPSDERGVTITFDDGYYSMYSLLAPLVREYKYPVTLFIHCDAIVHASSKVLTWDRLRMMEGQGLDIQAHSLSHIDLTKLSRKNDPDSRRRLFEEIYLSKRIMELYMHKKIKYFAFPYGRYDFTLIEMTFNAGYSRAFSTDYGSNIITRDNFCLRRSHIKSGYSLQHIDDLIK